MNSRSFWVKLSCTVKDGIAASNNTVAQLEVSFAESVAETLNTKGKKPGKNNVMLFYIVRAHTCTKVFTNCAAFETCELIIKHQRPFFKKRLIPPFVIPMFPANFELNVLQLDQNYKLGPYFKLFNVVAHVSTDTSLTA